MRDAARNLPLARHVDVLTNILVHELPRAARKAEAKAHAYLEAERALAVAKMTWLERTGQRLFVAIAILLAWLFGTQDASAGGGPERQRGGARERAERCAEQATARGDETRRVRIVELTTENGKPALSSVDEVPGRHRQSFRFAHARRGGRPGCYDLLRSVEREARKLPLKLSLEMRSRARRKSRRRRDRLSRARRCG